MRRERGAVLVVIAVAVTLATSACASAPKTGDGVLGLDWAVLPTPVVPTPKADVCSLGAATTVDWDLAVARMASVACTQEHATETFHVGTLTASFDAALPEVGDEEYRTAYEDCLVRATEFLGGDPHTARVGILAVMATENQWRGAARWYRCEMFEISTASGAIAKRPASLRDGLRGSRPLAITCGDELLSADRKFVEEVTFIDCASAHDVELTGVYAAPDGPYPGFENIRTTALDACYGVGAEYLGMTRASLDRTGGISWLAWGGNAEEWAAGDRAFWCFMGAYPARKLTASIKGRKPGSFPR